MDFRYSEAEEAFREELDRFFQEASEVVEKAKGEWNSGIGYGPGCWEIVKKSGKKGWLCSTWPKK